MTDKNLVLLRLLRIYKHVENALNYILDNECHKLILFYDPISPHIFFNISLIKKEYWLPNGITRILISVRRINNEYWLSCINYDETYPICFFEQQNFDSINCYIKCLILFNFMLLLHCRLYHWKVIKISLSVSVRFDVLLLDELETHPRMIPIRQLDWIMYLEM